MEQTLEPITEIDIMAGVVRSQEPNMSPEISRLILSWHFDDASVKRMTDLAEKNQLDTITTAERREMDAYRRVGQFLNLLQAKARLSLKQRNGDGN